MANCIFYSSAKARGSSSARVCKSDPADLVIDTVRDTVKQPSAFDPQNAFRFSQLIPPTVLLTVAWISFTPAFSCACIVSSTAEGRHFSHVLGDSSVGLSAPLCKRDSPRAFEIKLLERFHETALLRTRKNTTHSSECYLFQVSRKFARRRICRKFVSITFAQSTL